ncbi:hypothetical protein X777_09006, partial [Ooceraea biroi]
SDEFTRAATRARSNSAREIQSSSKSLLRAGCIRFSDIGYHDEQDRLATKLRYDRVMKITRIYANGCDEQIILAEASSDAGCISNQICKFLCNKWLAINQIISSVASGTEETAQTRNGAGGPV